jgi:hypothetical protein
VRNALIVVGLAVALAILGILFRDSLFPSEERRAEAPAPAAQSATEPVPSVERDAEAFIAKLSEPQAEPVPAKSADHFVSKDQIISLLPESTIEHTTLKGIESNPALSRRRHRRKSSPKPAAIWTRS